MESSQAQHEETVVPVKPALSARAAPRGAAAPPPRTSGPMWQYIAVAALIAAAVLVFLVLPRFVGKSKAPAPATTATQPARAEPAPAPLSPEEAAALKAKGEALLADLLSQQKTLETLRAESWGGEQWSRYTGLVEGGGDAFLANDFAKAVSEYEEATALGADLLARSGDIVQRALAAAEEAFAAGNADVALTQYDIVLGIEPENAAAKAGRARAERLPEVIELTQRADAERDAGDLKKAVASYREALAIDPRWEPAVGAIATLNGELRDADFEKLMSEGYKSLAAQSYADAQKSFAAALALRPDARGAQDGLTQSQEAARLDKIALTEARALAFEKRELWGQAIDLYKDALAGDPNLLFAQAGLQRSQARAALDAKLRNLIDNPTLLFGDSVLGDARKLVVEAKAVPEGGPLLTEQIDKLERLVTLAATPISVQLQSDTHTEVTLYRVGPLGVFASKQVDLRPGTYTAVGSRSGYRDVRQTFTVLPGRNVPPVTVVCTEPI